MAEEGKKAGAARKWVIRSLWAVVGALVLGAIGSMIGTAVFDWRLPVWAGGDKEEVSEEAVAPEETEATEATELSIDWKRTAWWAGGAAVVVVIVLLVILASFSEEQPREPTVEDYRRDSFFGMTCRWRYDRMDGGIGDVACFCPICDRQLKITEIDRWPTRLSLSCAGHGKIREYTGGLRELLDDVRREVQVNIRNGDWKHKIKTDEENC